MTNNKNDNNNALLLFTPNIAPVFYWPKSRIHLALTKFGRRELY